jgi:outer membrane protein TolC
VLLIVPELAAARYLQVLPSEAEVRRALQSSTQIAASRDQMDIAAARSRQLRAGSYEWTLGATGQRRTDPQGVPYDEQTYEISRGVRLWGKAQLDRALGNQTVAIGEYAFADNWHEAGRTLLSGWFEWLRARRTTAVVQEQAKLVEKQLGAVHSRVRAGDAPALEEQLAQAEVDRQSASLIAAQQQEQEAALRLQRVFPDLALPAIVNIDTPQMLPGPDEDWVGRILADNHELSLADGQREQAGLIARRVGRDRIPDPTVGVRYSHNFDGNRRVVGLTISVPLGGPARSAAYSAALAEASVAGQKAKDVRLKVEADARRATLTMRSTNLQWQQLQQVASRSRNAAEALTKGYSLGEFTITELLLARRQALEAEMTASLAQLNALEAAARLQLDAHEIWVSPLDPEGATPLSPQVR